MWIAPSKPLVIDIRIEANSLTFKYEAICQYQMILQHELVIVMLFKWIPSWK